MEKRVFRKYPAVIRKFITFNTYFITIFYLDFINIENFPSELEGGGGILTS